ncbi:hypothetical protein BC834DRAFT_970799 [Gloeopeniophorella convolvens]|nr:hypothetical protein BC834DRAFT_970799 [Gloeopeniophorella convolvens]
MARKHEPAVPFFSSPSHPSVALYQDMGYGLRKDPSQRRRVFRAPLVNQDPFRDLNTWDSMFMERLIGDIAMHRPTSPPNSVLALGNGSEYWALNAAQKWPRCRIAAHGLLSTRSGDLTALLRLRGLADRVTHVQGDPSKGLHLDYSNNTFDMVRLSYCSLNLAETEWFVFLQEVNRVMKPGGVLEIMEEDFLFPGRGSLDPGAGTGAGAGVKLSAVHQHPLQQQSASSTSTLVGSQPALLDPDTISIETTKGIPFSPLKRMRSNNGEWEPASISLPPPQFDIHPFEHSRLARAWDEMLTSRWISGHTTSVLSLYLSAIFETFRALPPLEISLPPSSVVQPSESQLRMMIDPEPFRHLAHLNVSNDGDAPCSCVPDSEAPPHFIPSHPHMHLARTVALVSGCKTAVWEGYNKLYKNDPARMPRLVRNHNGELVPEISEQGLREEFEDHWVNWECDMRSRINLHALTQAHLRWPETFSTEVDSESAQALWLKNVENHIPEPPQSGKREVFRCVRGFVAWKFRGGGGTPEPGAVGVSARPSLGGGGGSRSLASFQLS